MLIETPVDFGAQAEALRSRRRSDKLGAVPGRGRKPLPQVWAGYAQVGIGGHGLPVVRYVRRAGQVTVHAGRRCVQVKGAVYGEDP
jgi:hypothetical protein